MAGSISRSEYRVTAHRFKAMGSPCEIRFYSQAKNDRELLDRALARLYELEQKYTRYQAQSLTSTINAAAGSGQAIALDDETVRLLDYADHLFEQSDRMFDITSGILRRAWDFRSGRLPSQDEIDALLPNIGWDLVARTERDIYLPRAGMEIDFGGFVKEYAADQVAQLLLDAGISHGLVNFGGDLRVLGPHPDGAPWVIGIQHPRQAGQAIASIYLKHGAIATSGDYERFMMIDGVRYCHVLNPLTGWPVQPAWASVSIVSSQCVLSGSFSTMALLKGAQEPDWLEQSGADYLCVSPDMQLDGKVPFRLPSLL